MRAAGDVLLPQSCGRCQSCFVELLCRELNLLLRLLGAHSILHRCGEERCAAAVVAFVLLLARRRKDEGPRKDTRFRNMVRKQGGAGVCGEGERKGEKS